MDAKTAVAKHHIEALVDSINPQPEARAAILAVAVHAYTMGVSHTVVDYHVTTETAAKVARDLAAEFGIQFKTPQAPNTTG